MKRSYFKHLEKRFDSLEYATDDTNRDAVMDHLTNSLCEASGLTSEQARKWVNKFLSNKAQDGLIEFTPPNSTVKPHRKSVISNRLRVNDLELFEKLDRAIKQFDRSIIPSRDVAYYCLFHEIASLNLVDLSIALAAISSIVKQPPKVKNSFVQVRLEQQDLRLVVGANYRRCVRKINKSSSPNSIDSAMKRGLNELLEEQDITKKISLSRITLIARTRALRLGLPPYLASAMAGKSVPIPHDATILPLLEADSVKELPLALPIISTKSPNRGLPVAWYSSDQNEEKTRGVSLAKANKLLKKVEDRFPKRLTSHSRPIVDKLIASAREEIHNATIETSAHRLLLEFLLREINSAKINAKTAITYLSELTKGTAFEFDNVDLCDWSADDFEDYVNELGSYHRIKYGNERRGDRRRDTAKIQRRALKFLNFCRATAQIDAPEISVDSANRISITNRNVIVPPSYLDKLCELIHQDDPSTLSPTIISLILAQYGGLRASEIRNLKLADVSRFGDEACAKIKSGKTPAARRRILLHAFIPSRLIDAILEFKELRVKEIGEQRKAKSSFLLSDDEGERNQITNDCNAYLTALWGPKVTLHTLRHSFVSINLIRLYAIDNPSILDDLFDQDHDLFGDEMNEKLVGHYQDFGERNSPLIELLKVIGHAGVDVFFNTYAHSVHLILKHEMTRLGILKSK